VKRIPGANRLERKGAADPLDHLGIDLEKRPVCLHVPKPGLPIGDLCLGEATHASGADEDPTALDQGEVLGQHDLCSGQGFAHGFTVRIAQKPR
jgi:hypothetical protein